MRMIASRNRRTIDRPEIVEQNFHAIDGALFEQALQGEAFALALAAKNENDGQCGDLGGGLLRC